MLKQSEQAKHDVKAIKGHIKSVAPKQQGYTHYNTWVKLVSIPNDDQYGEWTPQRVGHALIDYVDNGWAPFGGFATLRRAEDLEFQVQVYTD
jgi:hypothetical protein